MENKRKENGREHSDTLLDILAFSLRQGEEMRREKLDIRKTPTSKKWTSKEKKGSTTGII